MVPPDQGLTPDQLALAQSRLAHFLPLLRSQGGGEPVLTQHNPDGTSTDYLARHIRRLRYALFPMSPRLRALTYDLPRTPENEAERRALRAAEYPESPRTVVSA
jgi:hypothetical protein